MRRSRSTAFASFALCSALVLVSLSSCIFASANADSARHANNNNDTAHNSTHPQKHKVATPWVAVFLPPAQRDALQKRFYNASSGSGSKVVVCDHMTLQFDPPTSNWTQYYGQTQTMRVLAYADDPDHGQAVMVHVEQGDALSTNSHPHITVSHFGHFPYTAVYSNILWERLEEANGGPMTVSRDATGAPSSVSLTSGTQWTGDLPEYDEQQAHLKHSEYHHSYGEEDEELSGGDSYGTEEEEDHSEYEDEDEEHEDDLFGDEFDEHFNDSNDEGHHESTDGAASSDEWTEEDEREMMGVLGDDEEHEAGAEEHDATPVEPAAQDEEEELQTNQPAARRLLSVNEEHDAQEGEEHGEEQHHEDGEQDWGLSDHQEQQEEDHEDHDQDIEDYDLDHPFDDDLPPSYDEHWSDKDTHSSNDTESQDAYDDESEGHNDQDMHDLDNYDHDDAHLDADTEPLPDDHLAVDDDDDEVQSRREWNRVKRNLRLKVPSDKDLALVVYPPAVGVSVTVLSSDQPFIVQGVVCVNTLWNADTGVCEVDRLNHSR